MTFHKTTTEQAKIDAARAGPVPSQLPSRFDAAVCAEGTMATDQQREQISRSLEHALGPAADGLVHSVQRARTVRDLLDVISIAQRAITNACGKTIADEFASRYRGIGDD